MSGYLESNRSIAELLLSGREKGKKSTYSGFAFALDRKPMNDKPADDGYQKAATRNAYREVLHEISAVPWWILLSAGVFTVVSGLAGPFVFWYWHVHIPERKYQQEQSRKNSIDRNSDRA